MTEVKINTYLDQRRSRRIFDPKKTITEVDMHALLEAARWAPSGGNGQPWRYIVGHKGDANFEAILALLMEFNKGWAQNAAVLVLTVAQMARIASDGKRQPNRTAMHDLGMANMSITTEATARGLNVRMMGGYDYEAAKKWVQAEEKGFDLGPVMAIGIVGDANLYSEEIQKREAEPRTRKPISEILLSP